MLADPEIWHFPLTLLVVVSEADVGATKINLLIQDIRSKQLAKLPNASPKELWAAVSKNKGERRSCCYPLQLFSDINAVAN